MKFQILFEKGDRHDATIHYVEIIRKSLSNFEAKVEIIESIKEIDSRKNIIIVVNAKSHLKVLIKNPFIKVICWYQGIMPEELFVNYHHKDKVFKIALWTIFEFISLRCNFFSIFVSNKMKTHYEKKYKVDFKNKFYIMPCFNLDVNKEAFTQPSKYSTPTFLYAGTMSDWQCIDQMLILYSEIELKIKNAKLYLFTPDQDKAKEYVNKYKIENVVIDYKPYKELSQEIKKYKYGFIIREDIEMNRVATPTKMNSYLANGIIPIFSNCINSFQENLSNLEFKIVLKNNLDSEYLLQQLNSFESNNLLENSIYDDFLANAFTTYYNDEFHIKELFYKLNETIY
ncbi:glycosyltransferase family protein [Chryseobacterium oryzae]|uniref:Uncharacterized protein n=1 Tax=Chryseobacterium oryzae TaxID=2929799 RepID=A0ABY4BDI4_9FLAO|nr:hypothetical protein [Chryseobacterium oryzae]UOE37220.1 hypothetical protein MTP08_09075 [Chryseobacterium oryzae]